jgi:hypothetical protein
MVIGSTTENNSKDDSFVMFQYITAVPENNSANSSESEHIDPVYNTEPSYLSIQAKAVLDELQEGLEETDTFLFIGEDQSYGDCERDGSLEFYFSLYIFVKKTDGSIVHHKFYREYNVNDGKYEDEDEVPYEDAVMSEDDFQRKYFVYE